MRTTLRLDERLLADAKRYAIDMGTTLTAVVEDALRELLYRRPTGKEETMIELPTFGVGGLQPGVDLDDSAHLQDIMDSEP